MNKKLTVFSLFLLCGMVGFFIWAYSVPVFKPSAAIDYAPNFWFDSEEKYFPTDPFFDNDNLSGEDNRRNYEALNLDEKSKNFTVFYYISENKTEWVYEYWLYYVFNEFTNDHYHDWETVFVFVNKQSKEVARVVGSAHTGGSANNEFSEIYDDKVQHFWVYIGKGSHANCPDELPDGYCDFNKWRFFEKFDQKGTKNQYHNYTLKEINKEFISKFKNEKSFKDPVLGMLPVKIFGKKIYFLPLGGNPPTHAWYRPEYNNPNLIRPKLSANEIKKFIEELIRETQYIAQVAKARAQAILNNFNFWGQAAMVHVTLDEAQTFDEPVASPILSDNPEPPPQNPQPPILNQIQEQLDDISEKIDVLSQEVANITQSQTTADLQNQNNDNSNNEQAEEQEEQESEPSQETPEEPEPPEQPSEQPQNQTQTPNYGYSITQQTPIKILITEIQTEGDKSSYDFIEIYNPNPLDAHLDNYRLVKRAKTSSTDTTIKSWSRESGTVVPAYGYYLWASNKDDYNLIIYSDVSTSQTISDDNGIALRWGEENTGQIIDAVGWGSFSNVLFEGMPYSINPEKNQSLERKKNAENDFIDTDNNSEDFLLQTTPHPTNSNGLTTNFDLTPPETILDQNNIPTNPTTSTEAQFSFSSSEENSTFECALDSEEFQSCLSPKNYSNLVIGQHKFQVRAIDIAGNIDQTPASFSWTIENVATPVPAPVPTLNLLITEVQIEGNKSSYDFIELYNPNNVDLDISNYKLRKRSSTGSESSVRVFPEASKILANNYFVWANSEESFHLFLGADVWSTTTLAKNNSIAILTPEGSVIDAVAWGESQNPFVETAAFLQNPAENQSIERKKDNEGKYIDMNDNSQDFFLQENPNPKGQTLDLTGPVCQINFSSPSEGSPNFTVNWSSSDADVAFYNVQVKISDEGNWENWLENTIETQKDYTATESGTYFFKCNAIDKLYNEGDWSQEISVEVNIEEPPPEEPLMQT